MKKVYRQKKRTFFKERWVFHRERKVFWRGKKEFLSTNFSRLTWRTSDLPIDSSAINFFLPLVFSFFSKYLSLSLSLFSSFFILMFRHPESRLARLFNGSIPIVLDSLKQHYFIDRDGKMFRHILNFLRTNSLNIPEPFDEIDQLYEEAKYYDIHDLIRFVINKTSLNLSLFAFKTNQTLSVFRLLEDRMEYNGRRCDTSTSGHVTNRIITNSSIVKSNIRSNGQQHILGHTSSFKSLLRPEVEGGSFQVIALNISPELGERIMISGERSLIEEIFPEVSSSLMDARSGLAWNRDSKHVIRFPLNGYCKIISLQAIAKILDHNFKMVACTGGGAGDGQQFSEYIFVRKSSYPAWILGNLIPNSENWRYRLREILHWIKIRGSANEEG